LAMWADTLLILFISICTALLGEVLLMDLMDVLQIDTVQ